MRKTDNVKVSPSPYREKILGRRAEYEAKGWFDRDLEDDPPAPVLRPDDIEYVGHGAWKRLQTRIANGVAHAFYEKKIREGQLVIKEVKGIENYMAVRGGAILTCNHFHPYDNYAVYKAIEHTLRAEKRQLYKVIREGNYTNFPGLYGYFFRHCNTLPLSSDFGTMKKMLCGVDTLLKQGEKILIYPEQGMWWNYRKPRPLKDGAFQLAVRSGVPVIPFFISMEDGEELDGEGYPVQMYTVHILPAVYAKENLTKRQQIWEMNQAVYRGMKETYEAAYGCPLRYACEAMI
jgi:1-acyl-sn-glycerol-3-phosphate acyltransferase